MRVSSKLTLKRYVRCDIIKCDIRDSSKTLIQKTSYIVMVKRWKCINKNCSIGAARRIIYLYFNFHYKTIEHIELKKVGLYGMHTISLFLDDTSTIWSLIIFISILSFVYFYILHAIQFHKSLEFHLSITHFSLFPYAFIHPRSRILSTVIYSFSVSNVWNSDINFS